ncbi:DUF5606 family protein [Cytophaga hutchinsonii]|jgi:dTDP-4-dehydrorhamnose reductase|uniref:Uncharacterized protein n=1 Tax=Cytophaga hutchinsonii (strain ATCC 33406 / DSM 1761 / CIP 103989 / NBRC 15051 / NCIMB 9469 / D465) TaxID=269798 RepID=A0A6N4SU39_CYTH3|nr:DUF5606 domain-containing protein [Cytophaga hutchinsonii]ABG59968.1 conserved hypothetical protein [Cytophaga hutchinsonii ATCC 33406]SFX26533.1 hypothetical protein SAMN04487930_102334 [Cytophaga hutchinsonii ATCC 33406]
MELREVAAVSGRGGLFKILKPTKNGVILEAIDPSKKRFVAGANERVSILNEISIYTTDKDGSVPLESVLHKIHAKYGADTKITGKSSNDELGNFLSSILPEYDREKVYHSDIKKLANWYAILQANFPELLVAKKEAAPKTEAKPAEAKEEKVKAVKEEKAEAPAPAAKKAAAKKVKEVSEEATEKPAAKKAAAKKTAKAKGE